MADGLVIGAFPYVVPGSHGNQHVGAPSSLMMMSGVAGDSGDVPDVQALISNVDDLKLPDLSSSQHMLSRTSKTTPHAARRTPHTAHRTPHAALRTPHMARRTRLVCTRLCHAHGTRHPVTS